MTKYKKYNIGSPKRKSKTPTRTHSKMSLKKYNIGRPEKVPVTPDTPRSRKWKEMTEKDGHKKYEIGEYQPEDESDFEAIKKRRELGITTPTKYTGFEEGTTKFMEEANKKKPLTDVIEQVDEKKWTEKEDDIDSHEIRRRNGGKSRRRRHHRRNKSRSKSRMQKRI
jgi:hypothetical protein